ncbi:Putative Ca2+/H+ antiporter, TMEM165/GDT1 family [Raineyella antarctica]|uniref:GDT1 family protein n=2 Tax=Raineyella antarctica TaxID=1577474 RepID=A0A1G6H6T1_9ACTN|nr:Putative Ca2+/H+ antiporter, TMEM165/GDT1 family [Raineyella antarctica]
MADETFDCFAHHRTGTVGVNPIGSPVTGPGEDSMNALLLSTAVIFIAELGDKSQLMAMTFAARYRPRDVLIGISIATAIVHLASVAIGYFIGDVFAQWQGGIAVVAGIAFFVFALWTLRGDELTDEEAEKARKAKGFSLVAVGTAFFLAELGDKTMLATITLATQENWFWTWIGSTVGMVAADALAILVGYILKRQLPERVIKYGAAALFAVFGLLLVLEGTGVIGGGAGLRPVA